MSPYGVRCWFKKTNVFFDLFQSHVAEKKDMVSWKFFLRLCFRKKIFKLGRYFVENCFKFILKRFHPLVFREKDEIFLIDKI